MLSKSLPVYGSMDVVLRSLRLKLVNKILSIVLS